MKEKHAPKQKRVYQKPQLYKWTRQRESEQNILLIAGYAQPMELIVSSLGSQGLLVSWKETNNGNKFLTIQRREPTQTSGNELCVLDLREVSIRTGHWLSEFREDLKFSPNVALLLMPPDLPQQMQDLGVGSCWQILQSLTPADLTEVLGTFFRMCVSVTRNEAENSVALSATGRVRA